jgi:hypothetical protein
VWCHLCRAGGELNAGCTGFAAAFGLYWDFQIPQEMVKRRKARIRIIFSKSPSFILITL